MVPTANAAGTLGAFHAGTRPGKPARTCITARGDLDADIYDRHADGLYRQALLTLGDARMAEQVVCDVIVDECTRVPSSAGGAGDASYRLPVSAYRRCQELTCGPARHNRPPGWRVSGGVAGCIDPQEFLSREERGALGLVLFGGLGYVQASHEVAISPLDTAALLRAGAAQAGTLIGHLWLSGRLDRNATKCRGIDGPGTPDIPGHSGRG